MEVTLIVIAVTQIFFIYSDSDQKAHSYAAQICQWISERDDGY